MSMADELRAVGLVVLAHHRRGHTEGVEAIRVELTGTGVQHEGAEDINSLRLSDRAVAYVERSGRVWLFADGPLSGSEALVVQAAHREATEEQEDATAALLAVLEDAYGLGGAAGGEEPTEGTEGEDQQQVP